MRFKIDENLPAEIADDLRAAGCEADTVAQEGLQGASDSVLLGHVRKQGLVFITLDKGCADVRQHPPESSSGLVLLRPRSTGRTSVRSFVRARPPELLAADIEGRLLVLTETTLRIR